MGLRSLSGFMGVLVSGSCFMYGIVRGLEICL